MVSDAYAPASASSMAAIALRAAKPGWKYISEPPVCGHSFRPEDVLAAIESAQIAASSDKPSARLPASAAPSGATMPVGRKRRARSAVKRVLPVCAPTSYPTMAAARRTAPENELRSDNASSAGQITTPWWQMLPACMSSRTRPCPNVALAKAASPGVVRTCVPMTVAPPSKGRASPMACLLQA